MCEEFDCRYGCWCRAEEELARQGPNAEFLFQSQVWKLEDEIAHEYKMECSTRWLAPLLVPQWAKDQVLSWGGWMNRQDTITAARLYGAAALCAEINDADNEKWFLNRADNICIPF